MILAKNPSQKNLYCAVHTTCSEFTHYLHINIRVCLFGRSVNISDYQREIMDWQIKVLIFFALAASLNGKKSRQENIDSCNPFIISR